MSISEWLRLPTRVSRVYPVFALALLLLSSTLLYTWKYTEINSSVAVQNRDREIATLKQEISLLKSQQQTDRATLSSQQKELTTTTTQLKDLEKTLQEKSDQLASKEAELNSAQTQLKNQQDQLSKNADELDKLRTRPPLFSFQNKSSIQNVEQMQEDIKSLVTSSYTYIQDLYGLPYLLNSITITFVDQFSIANSSGEIVIENGPDGISIDIHLKDFDKNSFEDTNTLIHEIIHGFHGIAVLDTAAMEEGITIAATDAVMEKMIKDGKMKSFSPLYILINEAQYQQWNQTLKVAANSGTFYSDPNVAKVYQMLGKAWFNLYLEDPQFFKKFNSYYYSKVQKGLLPDDAMVRDAIKSVVKSVKGQPIDAYLAANRAFNPS